MGLKLPKISPKWSFDSYFLKLRPQKLTNFFHVFAFFGLFDRDKYGFEKNCFLTLK
jgi:hypothetical protein